MWYFQSYYGRYFNSKYDRVGPLFQGRYKDRWINSNSYVLCVLRYIHKNPVEAALVKNLEDYRWSSYASYLGLAPKWPWLDSEWFLKQFRASGKEEKRYFREFHRLEETNRTVKWPVDNRARPQHKAAARWVWSETNA